MSLKGNVAGPVTAPPGVRVWQGYARAALASTAAALGLAAVAVAAWAGSVPGTEFVLAAFAWLLMLAGFAFWQLWFWSSKHWRQGGKLAAVSLLALALTGFGTAVFSDISLQYRFAGSEAAMTAYAQDMMTGRRPADFEAFDINDVSHEIPSLQLGSYRFEWITYERDEGYVEFTIDANTLGNTGFIYNPHHVALTPAEHYRHLTGPWYVMDNPDS